MGIIIHLPSSDHARASAGSRVLKAKTAGSTSLPRSAKASRTKMKTSCEIFPRARQLLTADKPTPAISAAPDGPPKASMTSSTVLSMSLHSSQSVNMSSLHGTAIETARSVLSDQGMPDSIKQLAKRLELTREALGLSAAELCKLIDCKPNRWSQYESGERPITLPVSIALCDEFGLSLDWIYRADPSRLPHELRIKIRQAA
jgi:ribosome-binding protein aMBF1 (putative translation factor)